jgi:hypothetical protein
VLENKNTQLFPARTVGRGKLSPKTSKFSPKLVVKSNARGNQSVL